MQRDLNVCFSTHKQLVNKHILCLLSKTIKMHVLLTLGDYVIQQLPLIYKCLSQGLTPLPWMFIFLDER